MSWWLVRTRINGFRSPRGMRRSPLRSTSGCGGPAGATVRSTSASHLLSSPEPQARQAGLGLLWHLVTSFPDDVNAKMAMEQLGGSLAGAGRLAEAERALRETLRMCAQ